MDKVYKTTYDGFYVVKKPNGKYYAYEGLGLCPKKLRSDLKKGRCEIKEINAFHYEAISYGYI